MKAFNYIIRYSKLILSQIRDKVKINDFFKLINDNAV